MNIYEYRIEGLTAKEILYNFFYDFLRKIYIKQYFPPQITTDNIVPYTIQYNMYTNVYMVWGGFYYFILFV